MTENDKKLWRERWLDSVNQLTSLELQQKSWLDFNQTNPHWSFIEFRCCYFDDLNIDDNYTHPLEEDYISNQEFEIIKDWHKALKDYESPNDDDYDHKAILEDSKWLEILQSGYTAKCKLVELLNETEKQILTREINYLDYI